MIETVFERILKEALGRVLEVSEDAGTATDGSQTTVEDTGKGWVADVWKNAFVHVIVDDVEYVRECTGNTNDTLTINALPGGVAVSSGDSYAIRRPISVADITSWGGTSLTGADLTPLFQRIGAAPAAIVLHASGAETADGNGSDVDVGDYKRAEYCLDVTGVAGSPAGVYLLLEGKDQTSGKYKTIDEQVITATGTYWVTITTLAFKYVRARWYNFDGTDDSVTFSSALEAKA